jgi:protein gp37
MGNMSKIEWTDATWPITTGCDDASPGCLNCYAKRDSHRLSGNPNLKVRAAYEGTTERRDGGPIRWTGLLRPLPGRLDWPDRWRKPRRIFVGNESDLFHAGVPEAFIDRVFATMARCPWHTFQVLTKRADRMVKYIATPGRQGRVNDAAILNGDRPIWFRLNDGPDGVAGPAWPLPNVWVGTSVENQKWADERIPHLLKTPAVVRFLSVEPLLGPVWLTSKGYIAATGDNPEMYGYMAGPDDGKSLLYKTREEALAESGIHWVIVGGESGPNARPFDIQWARSIIAQCKAANVPVFVKQLGSRPIEGGGHYSLAGPGVCMVGQLERPIKLADRKGGNWFEWPDDLRVREFPQVPARCD